MNLKIYKIFLILSVLNNSISAKPRSLGGANFGTHITPLITIVSATKGPILELGTGDLSTPVLHALCKETKRSLLSVDNDEEWVSNFIDLKNEWHKFELAKDWDKIGNDIKKWSIVFVDHAPESRRIIDIKRLRPIAEIIIVHDTELASNHVYQHEPYLSTFKYKYIYTRYTTETTIVSDSIDVAKFFEEN